MLPYFPSTHLLTGTLKSKNKKMHTVYAKHATLGSCFQCSIFSPSHSSHKAWNSDTKLHSAKKVSLCYTSVFVTPLSCVKQCRQDASRIKQALPPASGAGEVISGWLGSPGYLRVNSITPGQREWVTTTLALLQLHHRGCGTNQSTSCVFFRLDPFLCSTLLKSCFLFFPKILK